MCSAGGAQVLPERVAPFGYPRLSLLDNSPRLFAALPRPSSALDAKASTVRLNHLTCFRLDISPDIQLLRYCWTLKRLGDKHQAVCLVIPHQFFSVMFLGPSCLVNSIILLHYFVNRGLDKFLLIILSTSPPLSYL